MTTLQGVYRASVLDTRDPEGLARVRVRAAGLTAADAGDSAVYSPGVGNQQ